MKKIFIVVLLLVFFGFLAYVGIEMRDVVTSKNYTEYWQQRAFDGGDFVYVILGDANGLGVGASNATRGYAGLLVDKIRQTNRSVKVVNLSSKDATINTVINQQIPKIGNLKTDLVTVTVGLKDIELGNGLESFIHDMQILLPLLPSRVSYISELPFTLIPIHQKDILSANQKILELANINGVNTVLLGDTLNKQKFDIVVYDWGMRYPNDKGYSLWADAFWNTIQQ